MAAQFSEVSVRLQLRCVPLEDLFRTKPGVKSTLVSVTKERSPNIGPRELMMMIFSVTKLPVCS